MTGLSGFNTAVSGLSAAQRAIEVAAQNIANVNTPGYSRQQVQFSSVGSTTAAHFYTGGNAAILGGVGIDRVVRIRDAFLQNTLVTATSNKAALDTRVSNLSGVEGLLHEPGDDGIQASLDDFYASWHALAASPGTNQPAAGGTVLQTANAVASQLKFVSTGITDRWNNAQGELTTAVSELNQATKDLAGVNQKIMEGTVSNRPINELLDRRDGLIKTIGELAGGRATINADNTAQVLVGNVTVVYGSTALPLTLGGGHSLGDAIADPPDPPQLMQGVVTAPAPGGRMAGLLAALGEDIPRLMNQVNGVATALRDAVNAVHSQGYATDGSTGVDFFTGTSASDLAVVPTTTDELAMASGPGVVDGTNAEAIADLALDDKAAAALGGQPGPSVLLRAMAADIGTKLQGLQRAADVQDTVFSSADAAVQSDSGVSIDEEMTSLLQYQRSYEASARVITAVDEILDTLINRMAAH